MTQFITGGDVALTKYYRLDLDIPFDIMRSIRLGTCFEHMGMFTQFHTVYYSSKKQTVCRISIDLPKTAFKSNRLADMSMAQKRIIARVICLSLTNVISGWPIEVLQDDYVLEAMDDAVIRSIIAVISDINRCAPDFDGLSTYLNTVAHRYYLRTKQGAYPHVTRRVLFYHVNRIGLDYEPLGNIHYDDDTQYYIRQWVDFTGTQRTIGVIKDKYSKRGLTKRRFKVMYKHLCDSSLLDNTLGCGNVSPKVGLLAIAQDNQPKQLQFHWLGTQAELNQIHEHILDKFSSSIQTATQYLRVCAYMPPVINAEWERVALNYIKTLPKK